ASSVRSLQSFPTRRSSDLWVLNGQKTFITNALSADLFITVARTDPEAKGGNGFTIFVIEKGAEGFTTGRKFDKTGWLASDMSERSEEHTSELQSRENLVCR